MEHPLSISLLPQKWREMGSEQKQIYHLLFEEEKQRYNQTMCKYKEDSRNAQKASNNPKSLLQRKDDDVGIP